MVWSEENQATHWNIRCMTLFPHSFAILVCPYGQFIRWTGFPHSFIMCHISLKLITHLTNYSHLSSLFFQILGVLHKLYKIAVKCRNRVPLFKIVLRIFPVIFYFNLYLSNTEKNYRLHDFCMKNAHRSGKTVENEFNF